MKKVLLLIISLIFIPVFAWAYETVLIDFPQEEGWHTVYYQKQGSEAILQYVPAGQDQDQWTKTLIFHSYKNRKDNTTTFMNHSTIQMEAKNSSQLYRYIKSTPMDSIARRCVNKNSAIPSQCEIYRVSKSFEGLITMHYINKNKQNYIDTYNDWLDIVKNIKIYRSYYREDRILDKASSFEL